MKKALVVGINNYPGGARLMGCVNDATKVAELLNSNEDGSPNFDVMLCTDVKTKTELRSLILDVFKMDDEVSLFYFSGHGCITDAGGYIVTPDFAKYDEGIAMDDVLKMVSLSPARHKIVILDCCHSGAMGTPAMTQYGRIPGERGDRTGFQQKYGGCARSRRIWSVYEFVAGSAQRRGCRYCGRCNSRQHL
ncbi:caspase family protein [Chitinophaga sedimenti]|uniref:caspase family protein n=1 Tax=Chitinophaga sedimenti TaxID=2033606 RepID=UPI00200326D6|nr:caspase family protein [Chitinophaga sedimenti]MCK7559787.1 caspase family protein [Chitinophaga sedimenti]